MAIFEAEQRNKTASEDQLTSRIFGALSIMDKCNVLLPLLLELTSGQSDQLKQLHDSLNGLPDAQKNKLKVELWKHFGRRHYGEGYPDVYIEGIPKHLIVVEVKENTKSTSNQIIKQYRSIMDDHDENEIEVVYFLLTKDERKPQTVDEAKKGLRRQDAKIYWIQWKQVWKWIAKIEKNPAIAETDRGLLNDLIRYLEDYKKMKDAKEIKAEWFIEEVAKSVDKLNGLYREICLMVLKLRKELDNLELKEIGGDKREASFNFYPLENTNKKPSHDKDKQIIPSSIEILYKDKKWGKPSLREASIFINVEISELSFSVGLWNEDISEKECGELEKAAIKKGLYPDRGTVGKGKLYIDIRDYLIGGSSINGESKDVTFEALKSSLKKIRDFVREHYGIEQTPIIGTRSKRRK